MKQTSIKAYHELKESGQLTRLQHKVLEAIKYNGPMTGRQLDRIVKGGWKRLSELCASGVIEIINKKAYDLDTKKWVNLYDITGQPPLMKSPAKRKPSTRALQMLIDKMAQGRDMSALYAKAYEQGYKDAKAGYGLPEEL